MSTEQTRMSAFITTCVFKNATLPNSTQVGVSRKYTVQDLLHGLTTDTLRGIGKQLERQVATHGGSRFEKNSRLEIPVGSGIPAEDWITFLEDIIAYKDSKEAAKAKEEEIAHITEQLNNLKTKTELRDELKDKLAQLTGVSITPATSGTPVTT